MKKICFVAEYMYCGGTEKSLLSLLQYLDRKKYDITLLLMQKKGDLLSQLPNDIRVDEIPFPEDERDDLLSGRTVALKHSLKERKFGQAISKTIRGIRMSVETHTGSEKRLWYYMSIEDKLEDYPEEFDIVIDYMGYGLFNTLYAARKVKGKLKISWVHFEPYEAMPDFHTFRNLLDEYDHIMCVSKNCMRQVQKMMPELAGKCHVFYNLIDEKGMHELAEKEKIEKPAERVLLLSVGRLDTPKGFDIGIGAVERLYREGYPVLWQIIGEGWQRAELERKIDQSEETKKSIQLLGQKLNPYPWINACDIFFMPSRHEGYGIALAEARAFDKPIVATDFAGAREQLDNGVTGLIVECDEESMYRGLKTLLDNKSLRKGLSENLRKAHSGYPVQVAMLERIFDEGNEAIDDYLEQTNLKF